MPSSRKRNSSGSILLGDSAQPNNERREAASTLLAPNTMEKPASSAADMRTSTEAEGDGPFEYSHQIPQPFKRHSTLGPQSRKAEAYEKRIKRHWYPALLMTIALNTFLLMGVFYMIYDIDYFSKSRSGFLTRTFLIILVPLFPIAVLLAWPWASAWKDQRDAFSERKSSPRWIYIANILNGLACFFFVSCYLIFSAVPKFNTPVWQTLVDFPRNAAVPTLALLVNSNEQLSGSAGVSIPMEADGEPGFNAILATPEAHHLLNRSGTVNMIDYPGSDEMPALQAYTANISNELPGIDSPLLNALILSADLRYDASVVSPIIAGMPPTVVVAAFDSRLTIEEVLACNFAQFSTPAAFSQNVFVMSTSQIADPQGKMTPPEDYNPVCDRVYNELLPHADPPLTMFELRLASSVPTVSNASESCAIGSDADPTCQSLSVFTYGTGFVQTQKSIPGKSKQDIWIDCGAIVGAVQFFAWFMIVFFQP